ncbi:MAG: DegT/DnrJ/EryC1/StrS family aminotransferase [Ilumatobacteraceae bacterium]
MARIFLSPPDVGELERQHLLRAFDGGWIAPVGPDLDAFEREVAELTGWVGAVALVSGTAALHLALLQCGVRPGDDVLVSSFTFAASANAVVYCGANPVLIDSEPETWNMSPERLAAALARAPSRDHVPKAAIVVDLYGQCADYAAIAPLLDEHGVALIEDAAEAFGATYRGRPAGTLGAIGVYSFNGNKIVTTSGGGMLVTQDGDVAERVRYLATQARQPTDHYEHVDIGFNYRLSNLLAALGRAQLQRLPEMVRRRMAINDRYRERLAEVDEIGFMPIVDRQAWNGWLTCVCFTEPAQRDDAHRALSRHDIESRPLWKPMHLQPAFERCRSYVDGTSEQLFRRGLCLPSGSALSDEDVDRICEVIIAALRSRR